MNRLFKLRTLGYAEVEEELWFPNLYFNGLLKLNKRTGRVDIAGTFPNYEISRGWLYSAAYYVNGTLVFVPNESKEIAAYDMETGKFIITPLDPEWIGEKKTYFAKAYVYRNFVYLFPLGAKCMVRYDAADHSVKYLDNCIRELLQALPENSYGLYQQFEVIGEKIYMPFLEKNAVAVFDLKDEKTEICYLDITGGCSTINYRDGFFYLASWEKPEIYRWNMESGEILTYKSFPEDADGGKIFLYACLMGDTLLFFPEQRDRVLSLSVKTGEIKRLYKICNADGEAKNTFFVQKTREGFCILTSDMEEPHILSYEAGRLEIKAVCRLDQAYNRRKISDYLLREGYYRGCLEAEKGLECFVEVVSGAGRRERTGEEMSGWGERIFRQIRREP